MPPRNVDIIQHVEDDTIKSEIEPVITPETHESKLPPRQIVWRNVMWLIYIHLGALYGLYLLPSAKTASWLWTFVYYLAGALGITAGAHRLWSHRSFKAKLPLQIILAVFQTIAFQNDIIEWCRDHRVHHKYSETDADPHNAKRGFFFSHCGWLLVRKHPDVSEKGKMVDISDLMADPVCRFQRKGYLPGLGVLCFLIPTVVPWYFWEESIITAFFLSLLRMVLILNATWCVNSVAHLWGNRPYDRHINPSENMFVAFSTVGEGYHNYHHTFPHDYRASEFPWKINFTTMFIDFMTLIGQASDRKVMSAEGIQRRKQRTGDGTDGFNWLFRPEDKNN